MFITSSRIVTLVNHLLDIHPSDSCGNWGRIGGFQSHSGGWYRCCSASVKYGGALGLVALSPAVPFCAPFCVPLSPNTLGLNAFGGASSAGSCAAPPVCTPCDDGPGDGPPSRRTFGCRAVAHGGMNGGDEWRSPWKRTSPARGCAGPRSSSKGTT